MLLSASFGAGTVTDAGDGRAVGDGMDFSLSAEQRELKETAGPRGRRLGGAGWPGNLPARGLLRRAEGAAYWVAVAPLAARLPASLAYRVACWRGDWNFWYWAAKRSEVARNLRQVLELGPEEAERLARDFFRFLSCEVIDVMRLRGRARSLGKLVEIRGREHLDAALAGGNGVILCSAHFGSLVSTFSLLHASGIPLTGIGRWFWHEPGMSSAERWFWELVFERRVYRHRQRPNIEPWPGRPQVAAQAAAVLRANEAVLICSDVGADRARTVEVPLLGRQARLQPGVVTLSQLTGAPVLMAFVCRSADYRHQVLEISPPVPVRDETATAFRRCAAAMDTAIRANPAQWFHWFKTDNLATLGLMDHREPRPAAQAGDRAGRTG